jgi:hypothetical protein
MRRPELVDPDNRIYCRSREPDLRVIFRIDGPWVTTLDVGTHKLYRA